MQTIFASSLLTASLCSATMVSLEAERHAPLVEMNVYEAPDWCCSDDCHGDDCCDDPCDDHHSGHHSHDECGNHDCCDCCSSSSDSSSSEIIMELP